MSSTRKRRVTATISFDVSDAYLDVELIGGPKEDDGSVLMMVVEQLEFNEYYAPVSVRGSVSIDAISEERSLS